MIARRGDYATVEGLSNPTPATKKKKATRMGCFFLFVGGFEPNDLRQPQAAEGVGRQAKRLRWSVFAQPKPPNQGVEEAICDCAAQRL